jgi:CRP/FNR family transcriptional regulator, cyclic AMP receptor protein
VERSRFRGHPLCKVLTDAQLDRLASCARDVSVEDGALVFRDGAVADALYLLRDGCVTLEQHVAGQGVIKVESLCAGDILGLSWLFPAAQWTLDARAVGTVDAIALDAEGLRQAMQDDPALGLALLTHVVGALYRRLMRARLQRLDVYRMGV